MKDRKLLTGSKKIFTISLCSAIIILLMFSILTFLIVKGSPKGDEGQRLEAVIVVDRSKALVHEDIEFSANNSNGEIVTYMWDFGYDVTMDGTNVTMSFFNSRYYNVYLTVTDAEGEQDITMVNISIFNKDGSAETSGPFLDGENRRGPSHDGVYLNIFPGITNPTIYANITGSTVLAYLEIYLWAGGEVIHEQPILINEDLDLRLILEDVEIDRESWCDVSISCNRGYITNYVLELSIDYPSDIGIVEEEIG